MNGSLRISRHLALAPTVLAIVALLAALVAALVRPVPAAAQEATVEIVDFTFKPGSLEIQAGTTVTWVNNDSAPHTATGDGGTFDTGTISSGSSASITFDQPGTYSYFCAIHPNMTASIVVVGGDDSGGDDSGDGDTGGDDTGGDTGGATTSTNLPSTGVGASMIGEEGNALVLALLLLAAALGLTGFLLRRPRSA